MPRQPGYCQRSTLKLVATLGAFLLSAASSSAEPVKSGLLFASDLPTETWTSFKANGFPDPVTGAIYTGSRPASNGLPLGGIGTGCLDLETNGLFGYSSVFNSLVPRKGPYNTPFLGMRVDNETWVLSTLGMPGINSAKEIAYWGHYPIADVQYDLDAPIEVATRAWSPFIPGDVHDSNIPAAIFEVHLRNKTDEPKEVSLAFSFRGFDRDEVHCAGISRQRVEMPAEDSSTNYLATGIQASAGETQYAVVVLDAPKARVGREIGWDSAGWNQITDNLPPYPNPDHEKSSASVATDVSLNAGESQVIRFVLAWYAPNWQGGGAAYSGGNTFRHMYARTFTDIDAVLMKVATEHEALLQRILAWQRVVYENDRLPGWLADTLINSLHLITETAQWAQATDVFGGKFKEEDGLFGMNECPRSCPQIECIPCTLYGNLPIVYFFPELALSTLRGYKAYQFPNGRPAWIFGSVSEMAAPIEGYQFTLNGSCYAEIFNKLWLVRGKDQALLDEFYESLKKATIYTMTLRPEYGVKQIISMPTGNEGQEWFESTQFYGMCTHVGGVHLAHLQMAIEWAGRMGDEEFADQCREWLDGGSAALEEDLWADTHYLLYNEPESGHKSDVVMGYQLDGEWISRFHGFPGVFRDDRVATTLKTLKRINANPELSPRGALVFAHADGGLVKDYNTGYWTPTGMHVPSVFMLGMTYMYEGQYDFGLDLCRRPLENMVCDQRAGWDWTILYDVQSGIRIYGSDYYQDMMLWSLPAVMKGGNLAGVCANGEFVSRILDAGNS